MPPIPEPEKIREEAMKRIADRPVMVRDGDAIEELARAHERHAERLDEIVRGLSRIGSVNHLGNTIEGVAATKNIRAAVLEDPTSVAETMKAQATKARLIAEGLRQIDRRIETTENSNHASLSSFQQ